MNFCDKYNQEEFPLFELLPLQESCNDFLAWASPLYNTQEYEAARQFLAQLSTPGSPGEKLYKSLKKELSQDRSLETFRPFWERWYLRHSSALPVNLNPYYLFDVQRSTGPALAAHLTSRALEFYGMLCRGELPQDTIKDVPQSMSQYGKIFGHTRIPGTEGDSTFEALGYSHIVVIRKGRLFPLEVLNNQGERPSLEELERVFAKLWNDPAPQELSGGAFTAAERPLWAQCRQELQENPQNKHNIHVLESALFIVVLEDDVKDEEALCRNLLAGIPDNRWYDKSFQLIIYPEGRGGWNYEHSCRDGGVMARLAAFLCKDSSNLGTHDKPLEPEEKLSFVLTEDLEKKAQEIRKKDAKAREQVKLNLLSFPQFSSTLLKKAQISPDAFVQLTLLGTQQELWGKVRSAFESVGLRHFRNGRTEGTRPLTAEGAQCVQAYKNGASSGELGELLRQAGKAHGKRINLCREGRGIDGNLGFLESYAFYKEGNFKDFPFFTSPEWQAFNQFWMSTSATGGEGVTVAGYGPAIPEGFAVRYIKTHEELSMCITTLEGSTEAFKKSFEKVGTAFYNALEESL